MALSVERMFAVKFPLRHRNLSSRPIIAAILVAWMSGIFLTVTRSIPGINSKDYTISVFSLGFLFPTAVIIGSYIILYNAAKPKNITVQTRRPIAREVRVARMIQIVIGLFLFCWLPFVVMGIIYADCNFWCFKIPHSLFYFTKCLHYSNSMMNFIVYALRSPQYSDAFKALLLRQSASRATCV